MTTTKRSKDKAHAKEGSGRWGGLVWLWAGVLLAPTALLTHMQVNYTLAQKLCGGGRILPLHIVTILFLLVVAGCILMAWRTWQDAGKGMPDESADNRTRNRFLAVVGMMISALSFLIIVAQWIPQFIFSPCQMR